MDEAAKQVGSLLTGRSDAMIILAFVAGIIALWIWKVVIPERAAKLENEKRQMEIQAKQAETIAALGNVVVATHNTTTNVATKVDILMKVSAKKIDCLKRICEKTPDCIDIKDELTAAKTLLEIGK